MREWSEGMKIGRAYLPGRGNDITLSNYTHITKQKNIHEVTNITIFGRLPC